MPGPSIGRIVLFLMLVLVLGAQTQFGDLFPIWPGEEVASKDWPKQYVFRQRNGPDLVIRFPDEEWAGTYRGQTIVYDLHNQVGPLVSLESIKPLEAGRWRYRYRVCNGSSAEDPIESIKMKAPVSRGPVCIVHREAEGFTAPCRNGVPVVLNQVRSEYGWPYLGFTASGLGNGIAPGSCASRLDVETDFLPGIGEMVFTPFYVRLDADRMNWPDAVFDQAFGRVDRSWYGKQIRTVRPSIAADASLNERLENFREGIDMMYREGSLNRGLPAMQEIETALAQLHKAQKVSVSAIGVSTKGQELDATVASLVRAMQVTFGPWIER